MNRSRDEERRKLRCHLATVKRALEAQQKARLRVEKEKEVVVQENRGLRKALSEAETALLEMTRQRNKFKDMVFKKNVSSDGTEEPEEAEDPLLPARLKEKKKRGRKAGHPGAFRETPVEVDTVQHVHLEHCPDCQGALARSKKTNSHTVEDIPSIDLKPEVIQYDIEEQWCGHCKKHVRAKPVEVIPGSRLGINTLLLVIVQKYGAKSSWASIVFLLKSFFGIEVTPGALVGMVHKARKALGESYKQIKSEIQKSPVKFADETCWRVNGINHWLWGFFSKSHTYYVVEESRGKGVPQNFFKDCPEEHVLVRDDYAAYMKLLLQHQSCWAHLLRVSHEAVENPKASEAMKSLHSTLKVLFFDLSMILETTESTKQESHPRFQQRLDEIIATPFQQKDVQKIQTRIRNQNSNLITALLHPNVPLTNNLAERGIRPFVIARKMSGGSRSQEGAKTQAVLMSAFETFKKQNEPLLDLFKSAMFQN